MTDAALWSRCWSAVGVLGLSLSLLLWGPVGTLVGLALTTLAAHRLVDVRLAGSTAEVEWGRIRSRALLMGACAVGALATVATAPLPALVLVVIATVTCPAAKARLRDWSATTTAPTGQCTSAQSWEVDMAPEHSMPIHADLTQVSVTAELTDAELCHAWRRSFLALKSAQLHIEFIRIVALRQLYLDEVDRRSPSALSDWLASGARAADGPDRYLNHDRHGGRWDAC